MEPAAAISANMASLLGLSAFKEDGMVFTYRACPEDGTPKDNMYFTTRVGSVSPHSQPDQDDGVIGFVKSIPDPIPNDVFFIGICYHDLVNTLNYRFATVPPTHWCWIRKSRLLGDYSRFEPIIIDALLKSAPGWIGRFAVLRDICREIVCYARLLAEHPLSAGRDSLCFYFDTFVGRSTIRDNTSTSNASGDLPCDWDEWVSDYEEDVEADASGVPPCDWDWDEWVFDYEEDVEADAAIVQEVQSFK